jgi:HEAT repeat protein
MLAYNIDTGVEDVEALAQNLQHPELAVRRATVEALGSSAKMVDRASPMLKQCLTNSDSAVRETAARILKGVRSSPPVQQ